MIVEISDLAWISGYPLDRIERLKERLTLTPRITNEHRDSDPEPVELFVEDGDRIGIPRAFLFQNADASQFKMVDCTSKGEARSIEFNGEPVRDQGVALQAVIDDYSLHGYGGIICADPAWGKTIFAIQAIASLGLTTVIMVHREFLLDQWVKRFKTFSPKTRIGRIQGSDCEFGDDYDVSIAMVQSLFNGDKKYPKELWSWPGLTISDEVHRMGSRTWGATTSMFRSSYRLGLSATMKRSDGMHKAYFYHIGKILFQSQDPPVVPFLRRVFTDFRMPPIQGTAAKDVSRSTQLSLLVSNHKRNTLIVHELKQAIDAGRKCIFLSDRRGHLELIRDMFSVVKPSGCTVDFYVGGRSPEELEQAEQADLIFATYQECGEALDIPSLNTLLLGTPVGKAQQYVGRIRRGSGKLVLIDFIDKHVPLFMSLYDARRRYYDSVGIAPEKKVG